MKSIFCSRKALPIFFTLLAIASGEAEAQSCINSINSDIVFSSSLNCVSSGSSVVEVNGGNPNISINSGVGVAMSLASGFPTIGANEFVLFAPMAVFTNDGTLTLSNTLSPSVGLSLFSTNYYNASSFLNNNDGSISVSSSGSGTATAISIARNTNIGSLTNAGTISSLSNGSGSATGITVGGSVAILNSGTLTSSNTGGGNANGINVTSSGVVNSLTNTGTISSTASGGGTSYGIKNSGTITTLNNLQGKATSPLTYSGALPTNYSIIINSTSNYGQLAVTSGTGASAFSIYSTSNVVNNQTYSNVLSGLSSNQISNKTGTFGGYNWTLSLESGSSTIWDLIFGAVSSGPLYPSTADTQQSLVNTAQSLQGTYTLQNSVLANSFSYDCNVFGANDICVSAGGRNTTVQAANGLNNNSALLIAAYRAMPNVRIGAYADQNLSVSNPGGTVNLGNNTPLLGLFGAWNERLDGLGAEVKVSAAYGQKNTTVTRSVVGTSEPGTGSSQLNSQGAQVTAKYGFAVTDKTIVSPYVGVRYTQNNMGGYTEATSATVTAPLTYNALNTNATTALAGAGASYKVTPVVTTFASAGVETDTNTANGSYYGSNSSIPGLTPVNFNPNPVKTRPTATLGAYYEIEKNQRLGVTGIYRQEPFQAVSTTTVMATYIVGM